MRWRLAAPVLLGVHVASEASPRASGPNVWLPESALGWQAHSNNDLRLWPQLVRKSLRNLLSIKVDPHSIIEDGSFRLTHDDPVAGVDYNTTAQLLVLSQELLKEHSSLKLRVALCFKDIGEDPCSNSTAAKGWLEAVQRFFDVAEPVRRASEGRLEFVLDGLGKPVQCLANRFRPWNATWIPADRSPLAALTSDRVDLGYDRFQILNPPDEKVAWATLRRAGYGKFAKSLKYPFQLWEPDDQATIERYSDTFLKGPHLQHPLLGFDFAINIDPNMWSVFTGSRTQQAWNVDLPHDAAVPQHLLPVGRGRLLALFAPKSNELRFAFLTFEEAFGNLTVAATGDIPNITNAVGAALDEGDLLLLSTGVNGARLARFGVDSNGPLEPKADVPLPPAAAAALALRVLGPKRPVVLAEAAGSSQLAVFDALGSPSSLAAPLLFFPLLPGGKKATAADFVARGEKEILVVASNGTHLFAASSQTPRWALLGVGSRPSLAALDRFRADHTVALVTDGGYCFNSHSHNTRNAVKVCDATPTPCATALDYTLGSWADWEQAVAFSSPATPCGKLLHGTYGFGQAPRATLIGLDGGAAVGLLALRRQASRWADTCGCGAPASRGDALGLDGFLVMLGKELLVPSTGGAARWAPDVSDVLDVQLV